MKDKKEKIHKTNALRQLDKNKIPYTVHTYEWSEDKSGGLGVAEHFPELAERIFKTTLPATRTATRRRRWVPC